MTKYLLAVCFLITVFIGCKEATEKSNSKTEIKLLSELKPANFISKIDNDSVGFYTLRNSNGIEINFSNFGQRIISLHTPDRKGNFEDIVLGYSNVDDFKNKRNYYGCIVGRYGNRIAKAQFELDGVTYNLAKNNNENHLHGGDKGFQSHVWKVDEFSENSISFSRTSPDMEEGYPGNLNLIVKYKITNDNELIIKYKAVTDKATVINLTHHSFFNLQGAGNGDINNHELMINADYFTPVAEGLIPTGEISKVEGTPLDFTMPKTIGSDIDQDFEQLKIGNGYDHNFVLNATPVLSSGLKLAATVFEPNSGRTMEVHTSEPGVQLYTGNFLNGSDIGKNGKSYTFRGAFCLEAQHYPDSPNNPQFPSTRLNPGETYESTTIYKFGVLKE